MGGKFEEVIGGFSWIGDEGWRNMEESSHVVKINNNDRIYNGQFN